MTSYNAKNSILPAIPMAKRGQSFAKVNAATGRLKNAFTGKMLNGGSFLPSAIAQELDRKRNPRLSSRINTSKMPNGGLFPLGDYDRTLAPKQGNYLLPDINRPFYIHEDGRRRSEYRVGMNIDGEETLIPTVVNGRQLTDDEALQRYQKTGLHMGKYKTPEEADFQSRLRTAKYNMLADPLHFTANQFMMGGVAIPQVNGTVVASAPSSLYSKYKKRKR